MAVKKMERTPVVGDPPSVAVPRSMDFSIRCPSFFPTEIGVEAHYVQNV